MATLNVINPSPPLNYRFGVFFFASGAVPNPIDTRFKKVSGFGAEIGNDTRAEGGENLYTHKLPDRITYNNLVLERGIITGSPLQMEFTAAMSSFRFVPSNVMVTLFGEQSVPIAGWLFMRAYPVKWSVEGFNAEGNEVLIETMELAYSRFQIVQL